MRELTTIARRQARHACAVKPRELADGVDAVDGALVGNRASGSGAEHACGHAGFQGWRLVLRRCTTPHPHIPPPHPRAPAPAPHQHATLYRGVKPTLYWNTSSQSEEPCWTLTLTLIRRIRAGRSQTKKGASAVRPRLGWRPPRCTVRVRNCTRTLTRTLYGHSHSHTPPLCLKLA